jgi:hypothetical protein
MQFITFLRNQCSLYWRRWRWIIPIPVGLLLGYWACQVVRVLNQQPPSGEISGNALEAFVWAFGKPEIVYFVATVLFIYLVSDFLPANAYEQSIILRLGSRSQWWNAKVSLVFLSTGLYALLLFGSFFLAVLPQFPISSAWSQAGLNNFGMGLGYSLKNGGPVQATLSISALLLIGWFALGLLVLTVNQLTRRSWTGFLCGALIIITAELGSISGGPIGGEGWLSYLLIQNHLEYTPLWAPVRIIPESTSWIFWIVWILVCCLAGWVSSKNNDFVSTEK